MEKLCLKEDLSICDGNDICGNISGYVACLRLNDGKRSKGTDAQIIGKLCGSLEKSGMQIEYVSGIRLTSRRTADQQRQGTVCYRVLGQIIVDDQLVQPE